MLNEALEGAAVPQTPEVDQSAGLTRSVAKTDPAMEGWYYPSIAMYPGLGERWGRPREDQLAVLVPADSFRRLTEKIVRGIFYVEDRKFIEPPFAVEFLALDPSNGKLMREVIDKFGATYAREPGVAVRRAVAPADGMSSMFEIEFWGQFKTYAFVIQAS